MTPFSRASSLSSKLELGEDVAEHVERDVDGLAEDARRVVRELDRGRGVDLAADVLDVLGDPARGAAARALEGHVLDEVREAVLGLALVARPRPDPDAERRRLDVRHALGHDRQAVRERRDLELEVGLADEMLVHAALSVTTRARSRMKRSTAAWSFARRAKRSGRSISSARCGGSSGRTPVAR